MCCVAVFFFNDTATTEIYALSLHDALPICRRSRRRFGFARRADRRRHGGPRALLPREPAARDPGGWRRQQHNGRRDRGRSEEHTSELQSRQYLVCRLLLEKKKNVQYILTLS